MAEKRKVSTATLIAILVAVCFAGYSVYQFVGYVSRTQFDYCLATEGTLDTAFDVTAVLIREESRITNSGDGIVLYSHADGAKLKADSVACTLIENDKYGSVLTQKLAEIYEQLDETAKSEDIEGLSETNQEIENLVEAYQKARRDNNYALLYSLEQELTELKDYRRELYVLSNDETVLALLAEQNIFLDTQSATRREVIISAPGVIEYRADGYEGWTVDDITYSFFTTYDGVYNYPDMTIHEVKSGELLYRLITSQTWYLTFYVNRADVTYFSSRSNVSFSYNGTEKLTAKVKSIHTEKVSDTTKYKVTLELNERMEAHANERIAKLTFLEDSQSGIKISETCLAQEEYYVLPIEYLITSESQSGVSFVESDGKKTFEALSVTISDDKTAFYFQLTGTEKVREGTTVAAPNGNLSTISNTVMLNGVYVVNTGAAVFTPVTVLAEQDGYILVKGIKTYDRVQIVD